MITIHARVAAARGRLRAAGIPSDEADLDARLLAEHVLGWTADRFFAHSSDPATPDFDARFEALIARRAAREPYAYIVGRQEFWGLQFEVSPAVLIPRPETESIVEAACGLLAADAEARVADVGTGSGCLAIAIARERPHASIVATDTSSAALAIARRNAERLEVSSRVTFRQADLLDDVGGAFDLVVSNPPYVRDSDRAGIQAEVAYEPAAALYAGADGLDVIRRLAPQAADRLKPGGTLMFEFGFGQAESVAAVIAASARLELVRILPDLQGISRVAVARVAG